MAAIVIRALYLGSKGAIVNGQMIQLASGTRQQLIDSRADRKRIGVNFIPALPAVFGADEAGVATVNTVQDGIHCRQGAQKIAG